MNNLGTKGVIEFKKEIKFGDVILNHYAGPDNPHKIGMFVGFKSINNNLSIELTDCDKERWYPGLDKNSKLEIIGHIDTRSEMTAYKLIQKSAHNAYTKSVIDSMNFFKGIPQQIDRHIELLNERVYRENDNKLPDTSKGRQFYLRVSVEDENVARLIFKWMYGTDKKNEPLLPFGCRLEEISFEKSVAHREELIRRLEIAEKIILGEVDVSLKEQQQ